MRKVPKLAFSPTRLQHNDDPSIVIKESKRTNITFIIFSLLCSHYIINLIKKLETHLMVVSIFLKIKFRHAQISVPKIGILMSKTACINLWVFSQQFLLFWTGLSTTPNVHTQVYPILVQLQCMYCQNQYVCVNINLVYKKQIYG